MIKYKKHLYGPNTNCSDPSDQRQRDRWQITSSENSLSLSNKQKSKTRCERHDRWEIYQIAEKIYSQLSLMPSQLSSQSLIPLINSFPSFTLTLSCSWTYGVTPSLWVFLNQHGECYRRCHECLGQLGVWTSFGGELCSTQTSQLFQSFFSYYRHCNS